ncbi:MAG: AAA family ATPase [Pseudomonadota bacterium]
MINGVKIENFRCFSSLHIDSLQQFNVIVGDSASGKTALLEAVFLAMGASPELAFRFRTQRGFPQQFQGPTKSIERTVFEDLFHSGSRQEQLSVELTGSGPECRRVEASFGHKTDLMSFDGGEAAEAITSQNVKFSWRAANGDMKTAAVVVRNDGIQFHDTQEILPDFYYFFAGNQGIAAENADRYSNLSKNRRGDEFISVMQKEFPWIRDISIEVNGGSAILYADIEGMANKVPLNSISSGVNKLTDYLLALLICNKSVVLIDEIENGLYYQRYESYWRCICDVAHRRGNQVFVSTHSREMLEAIARANQYMGSLSLIRMLKKGASSQFEKFDGADFQAAIDFHEEIR